MFADRNMKYIPKFIGMKFPNLKTFYAGRCGLIVLRDYYFSNMNNLKRLELFDNKITTIESEAFKDLCNVKFLSLRQNLIETLEQNPFQTMVQVEYIDLDSNKLKFLNPMTFNITGGKRSSIYLRSNVCVNGTFKSDSEKLQLYLKANCTKIRQPKLQPYNTFY